MKAALDWGKAGEEGPKQKVKLANPGPDPPLMITGSDREMRAVASAKLGEPANAEAITAKLPDDGVADPFAEPSACASEQVKEREPVAEPEKLHGGAD